MVNLTSVGATPYICLESSVKRLHGFLPGRGRKRQTPHDCLHNRMPSAAAAKPRSGAYRQSEPHPLSDSCRGIVSAAKRQWTDESSTPENTNRTRVEQLEMDTPRDHYSTICRPLAHFLFQSSIKEEPNPIYYVCCYLGGRILFGRYSWQLRWKWSSP